jgi:outer membrane lipoprotein-sorting protein
MRKYPAVAILILLVLTFSCGRADKPAPQEPPANPAPQMTAEQVVEKISQFSETLKTFKGTTVMTAEFDGQTIRDEYEVWFGGEGLTRLEWVTPEYGKSIIVLDGNQSWYYIEGDNLVYLSDIVDETLEAAGLFKHLQDPAGANDFTYLGMEEVEGRLAHVLEVRQKDGASLAVTTWYVDAATWFPFITGSEMSGIITRTVFTDFEINPVLDPAVFTFTPPEGTEILRVDDLFDN